MYVVTKNGKKLPVDDSSLDYDNDLFPFMDTVGLYTEDTTLKRIYILQLQKRPEMTSCFSKELGLELIAERGYDHYPTQEEILWAMSAHGLTRYDIATVIEGYELDME